MSHKSQQTLLPMINTRFKNQHLQIVLTPRKCKKYQWEQFFFFFLFSRLVTQLDLFTQVTRDVIKVLLAWLQFPLHLHPNSPTSCLHCTVMPKMIHTLVGTHYCHREGESQSDKVIARIICEGVKTKKLKGINVILNWNIQRWSVTKQIF